MKARVFIAYSHHDKKYLADDSLLGYLRGLDQDEVAEFWFDERITTGDLWDDEIKARISQCHLAVVLVSELFLNSQYVRNTEIPLFLKRRRDEGMVILPVILSACDWQACDWLKQTQFLPKEGKNLESNFSRPGRQKELFLQVKRDLRQQIDRVLSRVGTWADPSLESPSVIEPSPGPEEQHRVGEWENPFSLVTANDLLYEDIPHLFVGEYTDFRTIHKHFDTILEGQRGTGKTMILRYMAFETQTKIWIEENQKPLVDFLRERRNYIGIYCRLEQGVFDRSDLDAVESGDRRDRLFDHRLGLFCLSPEFCAS